MKINFKKVIKVILPIAGELFPVIKLVERLGKFKDLSSQEKQDTAFELLRDNLVSQLLPDDVKQFANDPTFERKVRDLIDKQVELMNYVQAVQQLSSASPSDK